MEVQRVVLPETGRVAWLVLDDELLPVGPILQFLEHLNVREMSPNTIRSYAHHLKLFWEYLRDSKTEWTDVGLDELADFIRWLRSPTMHKVASLLKEHPQRKESTVNTILAAVSMFYDYHERLAHLKRSPLFKTQSRPQKRYKSFLHGLTKDKPKEHSILKLKQPHVRPTVLNRGQVQQLIDACHRYRDKFLIALLDETGMRIGQALGLRHQDIASMDRQIRIVPRDDNVNGARSKGHHVRTLDVSLGLMTYYKNYIVYELGHIKSDYVFVNLWDGLIGHPMKYGAIVALFRRLSKKIEMPVHPHLLRHTHATDMLRVVKNLRLVQERLGHVSIQTTEKYTHLLEQDMKDANQQLLEYKQRSKKDDHHGSAVSAVGQE